MSITDRIDAITSVSGQYAGTVLPPPRAVKIELTGRCNFTCFFCVTGQRRRKKGDMEWDLLTRLLRETREAGVEEVGLFYLGESLLHARLVEAIRFAKETCGFRNVFLTTNGWLATPARVYECARAGLDSLKFSLNAAERGEFTGVTGVDGFDRVVGNIKGARAAIDRAHAETGRRCGLYVSSVVSDEASRARRQPLLDELAAVVDQHYQLPLHGHAGGGRGGASAPAVGAVGRIGAIREPLPCWPVFTLAHITDEGGLSACCWDDDPRFIMADLRRVPFMEGWNGPALQALRRAHLARDVRGTVCEACIQGR